MKIENILICPAQISDIEGLLNLHNKYLIGNLTTEQSKDGFIRVNYSENDFKAIVDNNAIMIARHSDTIIGYYLLGYPAKTDTLQYQLNALQKYSINGRRLSELKVAYGAQAIVEKDFRGLGLTDKMLKSLLVQIGDRFDFLFSSVTKLNVKSIKIHTKSGYVIVGEDEHKYFVCLKIEPV